MNCKLVMWQKFAGNLCIKYLCCRYEFILDDHIRNFEGVTRWIQHKVTGSLHKRIHKLQTDNVKTALEFENYKQQLFRLPCGACEHNASTRSVSARDRSSDAKCTLVTKYAHDENHLSLYLYWAQNLPSFLFYLQTRRYRHRWSK